jgi:hypothetical protein
MRGRVLALQALVFLGSTPIGGPIVGTIAQRFGARWSLALGAVGTVAAGLYGLATLRRGARADAVLAVEGLEAEPGLLDPVIAAS